MPTYIVLRKFNEKGIRDIKNLPAYARKAQERAAQAGVTLKGAYLTQGEYDMVTIVEAPDAETSLATAITINQEFGASSVTMPAFGLEEMERILARIP